MSEEAVIDLYIHILLTIHIVYYSVDGISEMKLKTSQIRYASCLPTRGAAVTALI